MEKQPTYKELEKENERLRVEIRRKEERIIWLERMLFGSKRDKAPKAAGVIHTDFEKGFIRAEVIKYNDFITLKSEAACRAAGKLGVEGKEYVVQDGDIMHFLFNV